VLTEQLDVLAPVVVGVGRARRMQVVDAGASVAQRRQRHIDAPRARHAAKEDDLEGHDLVARPKDVNAVPVPDAVVSLQRAVDIVTADLVRIAHRPDHEAGRRRGGRQPRRAGRHQARGHDG
jgi:hypothetical protein